MLSQAARRNNEFSRHNIRPTSRQYKNNTIRPSVRKLSAVACSRVATNEQLELTAYEAEDTGPRRKNPIGQTEATHSFVGFSSDQDLRLRILMRYESAVVCAAVVLHRQQLNLVLDATNTDNRSTSRRSTHCSTPVLFNPPPSFLLGAGVDQVVPLSLSALRRCQGGALTLLNSQPSS